MLRDSLRTGSLRAGSLLGVLTLSVACGDVQQVDPGVEQVAELGAARQRLTAAERLAACDSDPRVVLGLVSAEICAGADIFFREDFDGNGRQCGTCHRAEDNFTISPAFIAELPDSDPLFVAEQVPALATLERPAILREAAMILENVDGTDDLANKFTLRSIPHTLSLATSLVPSPGDGTTVPPVDRTGWSGDGAPSDDPVNGRDGSMRAFLTGAINQHYPKDLSRTPGVSFRFATDDELDLTEAFQLALGRDEDLDLTQVQLNDADAEAGRVLFQAPANRCNGCHSNAGANIGSGTNRNFDTGVEDIRLASVDALGVPADGGFGVEVGIIPDAFGNGTFNTTPLVEAADTGPFFHTNAFVTIEDSVAFYNTSAFANSPVGSTLGLSDLEIEQIGRFLRVINIAFNLQIALQRLDAADQLIDAFGNAEATIENDLLELAAFEIEDAIEVSADAPTQVLSASDQAQLRSGHRAALRAVGLPTPQARGNSLATAVRAIEGVNAGLGSGLDYSLLSGNLMR